VGLALVCFGLLVTAFGFFSSAAPSYSDTLNIGLLNDKTNTVLVGGFMFSSGIVCLAVGSALRQILAAAEARPEK
jgi:hypothetical protein